MNNQDIIYLDNHLLVVNKPIGMATQPTSIAGDISLEEYYKDVLKHKYNKPGNVFLQPVHRIDRPVSGLVLFARTSKALTRLMEEMRKKNMQKIYHAIVEGNVSSEKVVLENYLEHDNFFAKIVSKKSTKAKYCRLHYFLLKKFAQYSLIEITLDTGRYHQIRAQLSASGHAILGDRQYGSQVLLANHQGILLHHYQATFCHPVQLQTTCLQAKYPNHWDSFCM